MQALLEAGLNGATASIPASETVANEYIYAKDMGRAVDLAATVPMPPQTIFNIGNGNVTSFQEVLAAVKMLCPDVTYRIEPGETPKATIVPLDTSAARRHLGFEPRYTIASAFEDYLNDMKAAQAHRRPE